MKKILLMIVILIVLLYSNNYNHKFSLKNYFNGDYLCYTEASGTGINLGFCSMSNNKKSKPIGESIIVNNLEVSHAVKTLEAKINKTEYLPDCDTTVIYAYSPLIKNSVIVDNKRNNLQIATRDNITIIGWPLILGSFAQ